MIDWTIPIVSHASTRDPSKASQSYAMEGLCTIGSTYGSLTEVSPKVLIQLLLLAALAFAGTWIYYYVLRARDGDSGPYWLYRFAFDKDRSMSGKLAIVMMNVLVYALLFFAARLVQHKTNIPLW